jgi:peptide/nickel transport system substrate-binding protein
MLDKLRKKLPRKMRHSKVWDKPNKESQARLAFEQELVWKQRKQKRIPSWRQFKYISSFFSARERFAVAVSIFGIIIAIFLGGYITYSLFVTAVPKQGGAYQEALVGFPLYLNPILASTNDVDLDLSSLLFSGLLQYDNNLELQTDLAESWEINEEGTLYTLTLKEGLTWHDGEELTIEDILFTYRAIAEPAINSPLQLSMQGIRVSQVDDRKVQFELDSAFHPFESLLTIGILPHHLWANLPASNIRLAELNIKPIGAGPWKFKKLEKDKLGNIYSFTVEPFNEYHGSKPYIQELTFRFYPDFGTAIEALNNNKVEGLSFLPRQLIDSVTSTQSYKTHHLQLPQYTALFLNQDNNPALQEKAVRQAIAYSLDRNRLIEDVIDGLGSKVDGPLLPGMDSFNKDFEGFPYNPVEAQRLLDEAGWTAISADEYIQKEKERLQEESEDEVAGDIVIDTGNQAVFREKDGDFLSIRLTTVDQSENIRAAELIRNAWQSIGFKVQLDIIPVSVVTADVLPSRDYEALLYGQILNVIPDLYTFWHSSQIEHPGLNLAGFADADADELLETARSTSNVEDETEAYRLFQDIIGEELPAIFLYTPKYTYITPDKLKGFDVSEISVPADRWNNIDQWYIKTKNKWTGKQ